jgi:UDP-glucose 4-epimerase
MIKRVLVTGGAGFIGTHLVKALVAQGHGVTVLDLNAPDAALPGVVYVQGDVRSQQDLKPLIAATDAVFHLAAIVSVPDCQRDPVGSFETNTTSTLKILEWIRTVNASRKGSERIRLVFSSSSAVYGDQGGQADRISEQALSAPLSFYGGQKLASEQLIRQYAQSAGLPSVVFRFFNVYGPGQKASSPYSGVISLFVRYLREKRALPLNDGGAQTRDFISVHDIVAALASALTTERPSVLSGAPINLGAGAAVTIRALAETLFAIASEPPRLENAPAREGDILHSCADISRAKAELGFGPRVALRDGLRELWPGPS